jgi:hypothetical protein
MYAGAYCGGKDTRVHLILYATTNNVGFPTTLNIYKKQSKIEGVLGESSIAGVP